MPNSSWMQKILDLEHREGRVSYNYAIKVIESSINANDIIEIPDGLTYHMGRHDLLVIRNGDVLVHEIDYLEYNSSNIQVLKPFSGSSTLYFIVLKAENIFDPESGTIIYVPTTGSVNVVYPEYDFLNEYTDYVIFNQLFSYYKQAYKKIISFNKRYTFPLNTIGVNGLSYAMNTVVNDNYKISYICPHGFHSGMGANFVGTGFDFFLLSSHMGIYFDKTNQCLELANSYNEHLFDINTYFLYCRGEDPQYSNNAVDSSKPFGAINKEWETEDVWIDGKKIYMAYLSANVTTSATNKVTISFPVTGLYPKDIISISLFYRNYDQNKLIMIPFLQDAKLKMTNIAFTGTTLECSYFNISEGKTTSISSIICGIVKYTRND